MDFHAFFFFFFPFRSGIEEECTELSQLLEGIISFRIDFAEQKDNEKEAKRRKDEDDRQKDRNVENSCNRKNG